MVRDLQSCELFRKKLIDGECMRRERERDEGRKK